ncbi:MAG: APC family permease [Gemmataceae bacterium]
MSEPAAPPAGSRSPVRRAAQVMILGGVMFTFISFWRTAAVVLCDLASTVYYIGGIVENALGPAAPWFILAVMVFSYAVRSVYLESCSLFVRGGVYKVVKEAMGGFLAKLSVSALMFDYVLTGPTSGVSAGQYIVGLFLQYISILLPESYKTWQLDQQSAGETGELFIRWGSVALAVGITVYFYRQNLRGIHESSGKALKIMYATTAMAVIIIIWCAITLVARHGPAQNVPFWPDLNPKVEHLEVPANDPTRFTREEELVWVRDPARQDRLTPKNDENGNDVIKENDAVKEVATVTGLKVSKPEDPLGFLGYFKTFGFLRAVGLLGLFLAFGHSILAMSGEETLAQVYREVESPKMKNFKRAAFIVFVYSLVLTAGISFLAVLIIPDEVRMKFYSGNLISGLARHVVGPPMLKLALETFVVVIGGLILAGAVNTAIIGSNGVLNRIAEDGVLPDWFLKPHPKYGTTSRLLKLIAGLQIGVIVLSMGHVLVLGEAYAFGVVWSFVFKALSMVVLRFKDRTPREYRVPLNLKFGSTEIPFGLILIFLVLLIAAIMNFFTKEVATVSGLVFTIVFLTVFIISERRNLRRLGEKHHEHLEQFNLATADDVSLSSLNLTKPFRKLVAIRSSQNLYMLEKALSETDPETTDVVVMTAKVLQGESAMHTGLDTYDQHLMTAVVERAEKAGKQVHPLIVPTNNPLHAVLNTARELRANELIMGASNIYPTDEQAEQYALYWFNLNDGNPPPLTIRVLSRDRDVHLDLGGGNRIPKISERQARSVAELRAAGVGVSRVLLYHDGSPDASDLFQAVLTALDPQVTLDFARPEVTNQSGVQMLEKDLERARQLGREIAVQPLPKTWGPAVVQLVRERGYGLVILWDADEEQARVVRKQASCPVFAATMPAIPTEAAAV